MQLPAFKLEEFWKKYEFSSPYQLCPSDVETWALKDILEFADPETNYLWNHLQLGYTESPGLPLLRKEIAKLYPSLNAENIITLAGAEEGIYCAMHTLVQPGDHVIVIAPCYQSLETLPKAIGAKVTKVFLDPKKGWKMNLDELEEAFRISPKLLIMNIPHNPTGALFNKQEFASILHLAKRCDCYIFSDEVYRFLEIDEAERLPSIADVYEKGISLNVMTKSFGLAGLRIGWLASKDAKFLQAANAYKLYTSICNSAPSEILALIALRAKGPILMRNRKIMLDNLAILDQFFDRHSASFSWIRPKSGPIGFFQMQSKIAPEQFVDDLVKKSGVLIMPGTVFDYPGNYYRIGFGRKDMPDVLKRFEAAL